MIDLMLHRARFIPFELELQAFAVFVARFERDAFGANDVAGEVGYGQAAFAADGEAFSFGDLGIDQDHAAVVGGEIFLARAIDDDDALDAAHLRRGDADRAGTGAHGFFQIGDEGAQRVVEFGNRLRLLSEPRVRVGEDFQYRHA